MSERIYAFYHKEHFRHGFDFEFKEVDKLFETDEEDNDYKDTFSIGIRNWKRKKYRVYLYGCDDDGEYYMQWIKTISSIDKAEKLCLEIHSHVNGCSLFEYNGPNRDGRYGDSIKITHKKITKKIPGNPNDVGDPAVCIIFDNDAKIVHTLSICPPDWA